MADSFQLKAILSAVDKMSPTLKAIAQQAKHTRKYLSDVGSSFRGLAEKMALPLGALSALTAGFGLAEIKEAIVGYTEYSESLIKMSMRTGIATDQLQQLKYVAQQSGVDADMLASAIGKLNVNIGNAAAGKNKNLVALFKRLHISMRDANGQIRTGADMLPQLADAFAKNKNPVTQARMGMALYSKQWQEIIPLLADGSEEIKKSIDRFKQFNLVMSEEDLKGAKELGDQFNDLKMITQGLEIFIANELVPVLKPLIEELIQWAGTNKKIIAEDVIKFTKGLINSIRSFDWSGFAQGIRDIYHAFRSFIEFVGGARNAMIALVVVMNLETITAVLGLVASVGRLSMALGALALEALAPIAPLQGLAVSLDVISARGALAVGMFGRLAAAAGVAGAAVVGWQVGKWANKNIIDPGISKLAGHDATLGTWLYDITHRDEGNASTPLRTSAQKVQGSVTVNFENAPQGMRVGDSLTTPGFSLDPTVGYRSAATGG